MTTRFASVMKKSSSEGIEPGNDENDARIDLVEGCVNCNRICLYTRSILLNPVHVACDANKFLPSGVTLTSEEQCPESAGLSVGLVCKDLPLDARPKAVRMSPYSGVSWNNKNWK